MHIEEAWKVNFRVTLPGYITLDKFLIFLEPMFSHPENGKNE
jgi:hypothetical protein